MLQEFLRILPGASCLRTGARRRSFTGAALLVLSACLAGGALHAQNVLVVAETPGPGVDFTSIGSAISAAPPGAIILVKQGNYSPAYLEGKGLTIVAEAGATVTVGQQGPAVLVVDLPAGQTVVLRGLKLHTPAYDPQWQSSATMLVKNCAGPVWIEDCTLVDGRPALEVDNPPGQAAGVIVLRSTLIGGPSWFDGMLNGSGGEALQLVSGSAHFYDCTLTGGKGKNGYVDVPSAYPDDGFLGVKLGGGSALFVRSTVSGGQGGKGFIEPFSGCQLPGKGGVGLHLGAGSVLRSLQTTIKGGPSGLPAQPSCALAPEGTAITGLLSGGIIEALAGEAPGIQGAGPVREGELLSVTIDGAPGSAVVLAVSIGPLGQYIAGLSGALLVQLPATVLAPGLMPPGGTLVLADLVPTMPPGLEGVTVFLQPAAVPAAGSCVVGGGAAVTLLDRTL
jgi:hypothetical protein